MPSNVDFAAGFVVGIIFLITLLVGAGWFFLSD